MVPQWHAGDMLWSVCPCVRPIIHRVVYILYKLAVGSGLFVLPLTLCGLRAGHCLEGVVDDGGCVHVSLMAGRQCAIVAGRHCSKPQVGSFANVEGKCQIATVSGGRNMH